MNQDKRKRSILKGILNQYFDYLDKANELNRQQSQIFAEYGSVKAVTYENDKFSGGGSTNDEKMASLADKITDLQNQEQQFLIKATKILHRFNLNKLSHKQSEVLWTVFHSKNYDEAGKELGYSGIQIYRIMNQIYDYMEQYL